LWFSIAMLNYQRVNFQSVSYLLCVCSVSHWAQLGVPTVGVSTIWISLRIGYPGTPYSDICWCLIVFPLKWQSYAVFGMPRWRNCQISSCWLHIPLYCGLNSHYWIKLVIGHCMFHIYSKNNQSVSSIFNNNEIVHI